MTNRPTKKFAATIAGIGAVALVLTACGGSSSTSTTTAASSAAGGAAASSGGAAASAGPVGAESGWCDTVKEKFGDLTGKSVSLYTVITGKEADLYAEAYKPFTECTGIKVAQEPSKDFEAQVLVRIQSGNPPDIAQFPQPGLVSQIVNDTGTAKPLSEDLTAFVNQNFPTDTANYWVINDIPFGVPGNADFKSLVWYSPKTFKEKGYTIPTTWEELQTLQTKIADSGAKPWCIGIGSGEATGWMITDWLEEYVLRLSGPDVYDQWVTNDVKFTDPAIAEALKEVGEVLKNDKMVNGGFGGVTTIASTAFQDPPNKILSGECTFWKFAANGDAFFPAGTTIGPDGDANAFYLPPANDKFGQTVLGGGTGFVAFADRPEVQALMWYVASPEFANARAKQGAFISTNKGLQADSVSNPVLKTALAKLQDPDTVFRFDASDLMPAQVGSSAEWKQFTSWITGQDDATTLANIQSAWPAG